MVGLFEVINYPKLEVGWMVMEVLVVGMIYTRQANKEGIHVCSSPKQELVSVVLQLYYGRPPLCSPFFYTKYNF